MISEAKALLALPGFAWSPGMVGIDPAGVRWVVYHIDEAGTPMAVRAGDPRVRPAVSAIVAGTVPDLGHGGTAGILLGMLWRAGRLTALTPHVAYPGAWYVELDSDPVGDPSIAADSLGVAAARALVAVGRCA